MSDGTCFLRVLTAEEGELGIYHYWGELLVSNVNNILMVAFRISRTLLPFLDSSY